MDESCGRAPDEAALARLASLAQALVNEGALASSTGQLALKS